MNKHYRDKLIKIITFLGGLYFFSVFAFGGVYQLIAPWLGLPTELEPYNFNTIHQEILKSLVIVGTMAFGLGIINIVRVHGSRIIKAQTGWLNSIALLLGMVAVFAIEISDLTISEQKSKDWEQFSTLISYVEREQAEFFLSPSENYDSPKQLVRAKIIEIHQQAETCVSYLCPNNDKKAEEANADFKQALDRLLLIFESTPEDNQQGVELLLENLRQGRMSARELTELNYTNTTAKKLSSFIYNGLFIPLAASMFALLAFYIASAAYRSFRIRSLEAFIMMLAALIVILGQIPQGPQYISEHLPEIRLWLIQNLSTPAFRAIYFGSAIAGLAMALRMWLSLEKSPLSSELDESERRDD